MAKGIAQHVWGRMIWEYPATQNGRLALLLLNDKPETESEESLFLRFALVTLGTEEHLFPNFLIDDWGGEVGSLALYRWVHENGNQFPRAEIFGFERNGEKSQFFVRELELYAKLPCYVYPQRQAPLIEGRQVNAILLPDEAVEQPEKTKRPSHLKRPFSAARVAWWRVPAGLAYFDFARLDAGQSV